MFPSCLVSRPPFSRPPCSAAAPLGCGSGAAEFPLEVENPTELVVADGRAWVQRPGADGLTVVSPDGDAAEVGLGADPHAWGHGSGRVWVNAGEQVFAVDARTLDRAGGPVDVGGIATDVVPSGGVVWVRTLGDRVVRIDAATARPLGEPFVRKGMAALVAGDGAAYVVAEETPRTGSITRIDARTGATRTRALRSSRTHAAWTDLAVGAGYVWIGRGRLADPDGAGEGLLARLDPETLADAGRPDARTLRRRRSHGRRTDRSG